MPRSIAMRSVRWLLLGLCALCWAQNSAALNPDWALSQYSQRVWNADDSLGGLPQNSVFSVAQTPDGYLWLATQEGLARFDGARFVVFNNRNTPALTHNHIWRLLVAQDGSLWIGTLGGGLIRYNKGAFVGLGKAQGLADDDVQALTETADGAVWVGSRAGALSRYLNGKFTVFGSAEGLPGKSIEVLFPASDGGLWVGTEGAGLWRFNKERASAQPSLKDAAIHALANGADGTLWVGSTTGLFQIANGAEAKLAGADGNIRALLTDRSGALWIGTDGNGLSRYQNGKISPFTSSQGLSNNTVGAVFEDREGSLWLGTDAGGLNRLKDNNFASFTTQEGLADNNARVVAEDASGAMWVGTYNGLSRYKDGKFTTFTSKNGLGKDVVISLAPDPDGSLWIGTLGGGVSHYSNGKFTTYSTAQGLSHPLVLALLADGSGGVWVGTRAGGLNHLQNGKFTTFTTEQGLSSNDIRYLMRDSKGVLWIATLGGGINRYQDGKFTAFRQKDGLASDQVFSMHEDASGVLWIGTFGGGLSRYKEGKFTTLDHTHGLYDDVIYQILEDRQGQLWMGSNRGVFAASLSNLNAVADGRSKLINDTIYGTADGMKSRECNGAHQPAGWRSRSGALWFPTIAGVARVYPDQLLKNLLPPPVLVEALRIDGQTQALSSGMANVAAGTRSLEFDYTGLSLLSPEKVRFKVLLEGFDTQWQDAGTRRTATYTNLAPGQYRFQVIATNNDGVWSPSPATLRLTIAAFFYQSPWFKLVYLLGALTLAGLGYALQTQRVKRLKAREQQLLTLIQERRLAETALAGANVALEEQATELRQTNDELERFTYAASHDLKEPLRSIISFTQLLSRRYGDKLDNEAQQFIGYANSSARDFGMRLDALADYLQIGKVATPKQFRSSEDALNRALSVLQPQITAANAVITLDPLPEIKAPSAHLEMLFQQLISNAIKFHGAASPVIHISADSWHGGSETCFCIADNGIGLSAEHSVRIFELFQRLNAKEDFPGIGMGLSMCKKIVSRFGGRIWVESESGHGSRFYFTAPAKPSESS